MNKLITFIEVYKENYYSQFNQILNQSFLEFIELTNEKIIFNSINNFNQKINITNVSIYSENSIKFTRDFIDYLFKKLQSGNKTIKIFSKRLNENTINIRFGETNIKFEIINL